MKARSLVIVAAALLVLALGAGLAIAGGGPADWRAMGMSEMHGQMPTDMTEMMDRCEDMHADMEGMMGSGGMEGMMGGSLGGDGRMSPSEHASHHPGGA